MARRRSYAERQEDIANPRYDVGSAQLTKFRAVANAAGGVMALERFYRVQYANAVEQAVLASQRASLAPRREAAVPARCASGTFHNDGESIGKAVVARHRAALSSYPSQVRRARQPNEWRAMYEQAMADKRRREAPAPLVVVLVKEVA
jgi:hypothetical protein